MPCQLPLLAFHGCAGNRCVAAVSHAPVCSMFPGLVHSPETEIMVPSTLEQKISLVFAILAYILDFLTGS